MVAFLKKMKALQPKRGAKFFLHQYLSGFDPARSPAIIHASDLTKTGNDEFCPREQALYKLAGVKPKDRWLTTSERMTFQIGRDQERNLVNWFGDMGRAVCHWKCVSCGTVTQYSLRPEKCPTCGVRTFEPKEMRFTSAKSGASCGLDMTLALGKPKLKIHEIKTIDKDQFKDLKMALAEHRLRTNFYLRIVAESDHPFASQIDTESAVILYVSKGGYGCADTEAGSNGLTEKFTPFKEFDVERDDTATDYLGEKAKPYFDFRQKVAGIPSGICASALSGRAKACQCKTACFGGDFPAGAMPHDD